MHACTHTHTHADAEAVSAINRAVESSDPAATLEAIKAPTVSIRSITDECTETYLERLREARQEKVDSGEGPQRVTCDCMCMCVLVHVFYWES